MESGLKRLFLRRKSTTKPPLISEPLSDTFRQTAGYDGITDGPHPTIGTRPIKPSDQKVKRKSSSHFQTKSVGIQEASQVLHTDTETRPRTAPGRRSFNGSALYSLEGNNIIAHLMMGLVFGLRDCRQLQRFLNCQSR